MTTFSNSLNPSRRQMPLRTLCRAHLHTYTHVETSHGLAPFYIKWPGIAYQSQRENTKISSQTQYGITSLSPEVASAEDLSLDDRKQSPLGPRHRSRGGRFTGENREYTTSHRSITQHCHVCFTLRRTHKNL